MYTAQFPPVSNRADWTQPFELVDDDTDTVISSFAGMEINVDLRSGPRCRSYLTATTANGKVSDPGTGVLQWAFTRSEMSQLEAGTYDIGVTIKRDDFTTQFIIGTVAVVDGIVSR